MRRTWKRDLISVLWTLMVTFSIGKCAIHFAYIERGYDAAGGEYLVIIIVCMAAWKTINYFLDTLEELKHERHRQKTGSRGTIGIRDNR